MGRRSRRRSSSHEFLQPTPQEASSRDHAARVKVSDDVWEAFKLAAGTRPVSVVLGELVKREVHRFRQTRAHDMTATDAEVLVALQSARDLHTELRETTRRLEWLASRRGNGR